MVGARAHKLRCIVKACLMPLKDLPPDASPREKLLPLGPCALGDAELLALLRRIGIKDKSALHMAQEPLELKPAADGTAGFDGIAGLLIATADNLKHVKCLCPAKRRIGGDAGIRPPRLGPTHERAQSV